MKSLHWIREKAAFTKKLLHQRTWVTCMAHVAWVVSRETKPSFLSTVRPIHCKASFRIRILAQLYHQPSSRPWFRQHLKEELFCWKFRAENHKLFELTLFEIVSNWIFCSLRQPNFLVLNGIQNILNNKTTHFDKIIFL